MKWLVNITQLKITWHIYQRMGTIFDKQGDDHSSILVYQAVSIAPTVIGFLKDGDIQEIICKNETASLAQ